MAAAGTLDAVDCPGPPSTAILLASCPSSSDTMRMSSTTDPPCPTSPPAINSARLNGSARRLTTACCPCSSPWPSASAAATSVLPPGASACPPLSPPSPVPAAASSFLCCSSVRGPSRWPVSGLSGDEGDDTSADVAKDVGEGGCGAESACMRATSTLTPTSPGPPYPLTARGAAQPPLPATGLTSAQACGTSLCTQRIVSAPWALPLLPPLPAPHTWRPPRCHCSRALRVLCSWYTAVPLSRPRLCVLWTLPGGRWPHTGLSLPFPRTPCHVPLVGVCLLVPLGRSFFSPCVSRSCARWAINSPPRPGPLPCGRRCAGVRSVAQCALSRMFQSE